MTAPEVSQPEQPSAYEQLSPEAAARIDATCDAFERAWKAAQRGGTVPGLASYLHRCEAPERTALVRELVALDRACRERYGVPVPPEDYEDLGAAGEPGLASVTRVGLTGAFGTDRVESWPSLPGTAG